MKNLYKPTILIFAFALIFSGCAVSREQQLAEDVVAQFHKFYNDQNYGAIFDAADEEARRNKSREGLGLALAERFKKCGKFMSSELVHVKIEKASETEEQVEFAYKSKFEKGNLNETFLVVIDGEKAALYAIGEVTDDELKKLK